MSGRDGADTGQTKRRGYKNWKGSNLFCFGGRIIGGPQWQNLVQTCILITLPTVLFFIEPAFKNLQEGRFYPYLVGVLGFITSISLLVTTAFTDPGIIPRSTPEHKLRNEHRTHVPKTQDLNCGGRIIQLKWCSTCEIYRPPRGFHCPICDNCVERFDHHCPWIGTCIGLRNYIYFTCFLWFLFGHCIFCFLVSFFQILDDAKAHSGSNWDRLQYSAGENYLSCFLVCYIFIATWFVLGLCGFHVFLVFKNETTNEHLRKQYPHGSPYSRGCSGNMMDTCCTFPESNVHTHHIPPVLKDNQKYIAKRVVTFLEVEEIPQFLERNKQDEDSSHSNKKISEELDGNSSHEAIVPEEKSRTKIR